MATVSEQEFRPARHSPWGIVALLWVCGFLNYADRQAVFSVFPLLEDEFGVSQGQLGLVGTSFSLVYAVASPFAGMLVDRTSRRRLIAAGLAVWSAICAATGLATRFGHLLFFRASEGLGESFYFPASMSLLADYHGPKTRSRAMSLHQTSVYAGTAAGGFLAGYLGQHYGWRSPFWVLGVVGVAYAAWLPFQIREPERGECVGESDSRQAPSQRSSSWTLDLAEILRTPAAVMLLGTFAAANFVAMTWLAWLPAYVKKQFHLDLTGAAGISAVFLPAANLVGAVLGGVLADRAARRAGGRILVQAVALLLGAPCVYAAGVAGSVRALIPALIGIGLCKGLYDANIFASLYDLIRPSVRGAAAGVMNTVGWAAGSLAPWLVGVVGDRYGLGAAITSTAGLYVLAAVLALIAAMVAARTRTG